MTVATLHVQDRDVGPERADGEQPLSGEGARHGPQPRVIPHDVAPEGGPRRQVRHPHRGGAHGQRHREVRMVFHRQRLWDPVLDRASEVVRDSRADVSDPRRDHFGDAPRADELIKEDVGDGPDEGEIAPTLADDFVPC